MSQTSLLLERLGALIQQSVRDAAARHGLLPIHIQVLHYLMRANRYSDLPIAIAEYFGITRGTVSQTLAVLERKGLLTKEPDAHHGKRVHLTLTPAGESVLSDSWVEHVEQALCERPVYAATLESTLRNLLSAMQRVNGAACLRHMSAVRSLSDRGKRRTLRTNSRAARHRANGSHLS